jgi:hypothetical protein
LTTQGIATKEAKGAAAILIKQIKNIIVKGQGAQRCQQNVQEEGVISIIRSPFCFQAYAVTTKSSKQEQKKKRFYCCKQVLYAHTWKKECLKWKEKESL